MEQAKLDGIKMDILADVFDPNRGGKFARFKRALWYGSTGPIGGYLGDGKGLRKAIRNMPEKQFKKNTVGLVGQPIRMALAPVAAVPVVGPLLCGAITGVIVTPLEIAVDEVVSQMKNLYRKEIDKEKKWLFDTSIKKHYKEQFRRDFNIAPRSVKEEMRKQIKQDIKELRGADTLLAIDRNMVKMKAAQHSITPSIKKLESLTGSTDSHLDENFYKHNEKRMEAASDALTSIVETQYYIRKITLLIDTMQDALNKVKGQLNDLDKNIQTADEKLGDYILKNL